MLILFTFVSEFNRLHIMKSNFLAFLMLALSLPVFSQTQLISYPSVGKGVATTFVTDYHCLGINPSALGQGTGYKDKKVTMGMTEFAFGITSDALTTDRLKNLYGSLKDKALGKKPVATAQNQKDAIADYAQSGVSIYFDYNWLGFSYQNAKLGGIAINVRESYSYYSKFNQDVTDLIFRGNTSSYFDSLTIAVNGDTSIIANSENISQDTLSNVVLGTMSVPLNLSQLTKDSEVKMVWNRTYNFGYGRKIFGIDSTFILYGGVGGRYIQSMAMFNFESGVNGLMMTSAMTPTFKIDYGSVAAINPSSMSPSNAVLPKAIGDGYGIDLSASVLLFKNIKVAAAINNIGQVTYDRNVYSVKDTLVTSVSLSGLSDFDVTQSINQFLTTGGILTLEGKEKYVLKNASDFRFGASVKALKILNLGFDMVAPFNKENPGSIKNPIYSFGGEIRPVKWMAISCGYFGGGIYKTNIPVGVNFILKDGGYEFGISSRDITSFFSQNSHSLSAAMGFARMRF